MRLYVSNQNSHHTLRAGLLLGHIYFYGNCDAVLCPQHTVKLLILEKTCPSPIPNHLLRLEDIKPLHILMEIQEVINPKKIPTRGPKNFSKTSSTHKTARVTTFELSNSSSKRWPATSFPVPSAKNQIQNGTIISDTL